ncbi:MAG TPA: glycoside hydrolase family 28 protein, partial [Candidatus Ventricola intestinavium]|nr:glycoside hydrolase family 28 protein [Candidatus Ventricola intestinavium]
MKKLLVLTLAWILILSAAVSGTAQETEQELTWAAAEEILTHISDPVFPDYEVSVLDFGAKADGITLDTQAFADAIEHVHNAGGGTVNVPSGTYLTGAITLLSNVELHLEDEDTVIRFTDEINEENYPLALVHWEASECYNYRSMIYAHEATNIAVTGPGLLDGQADEDTWYNWTKSNNETTKQSRLDLMEMNVNQVPVEERVFGDGSMLRNNMIQLVGCENVLLEGFTIHNSPMWQVNPVLCTNITVRGLVIDSTGPNNDGCNPESCNYVLIEDCSFNTGDDCIAIKSGRDEDGHRLNTPCQNIVVRNCEFVGGGGCITVGSEMSGGVSNVFVTDCELTSTSLDFAFRFKTNKQRGGYVENLYIRNIDVVGGVSNATLHATMLYEEGPNG